MLETRITIALVVLAVVALIAGFFNAPEPEAKNVLHTVSMGFVVSVIFYFIVVWVPRCRQKRRLRHHLQKQYDAFRLRCIHEFLIANGSSQRHYPGRRQRRALLQKNEFCRFFRTVQINDDGQTRWDVVMETLDDDTYGTLKDILHELEILRENIIYALNHIDIHDDEVFEFLQHLSHVILCVKDVDPRPDYRNADMRRLEGTLFTIFTGWSITTGFQKEDIIQSMIERI